MLNEETTAGIMVTEDAEEVAYYVRAFFRFLTMIVEAFKELYAYFTEK